MEPGECPAPDECPICMHRRAAVETGCGHAFCEPCLVTALRRSELCPLCRTVVLSYSDEAGAMTRIVRTPAAEPPPLVPVVAAPRPAARANSEWAACARYAVMCIFMWLLLQLAPMPHDAGDAAAPASPPPPEVHRSFPPH